MTKSESLSSGAAAAMSAEVLHVILLLCLLGPLKAMPNVVVILCDDVGYPDERTPHIKRLCEESTRLDRFFVSPTGAPTRAALLTGWHEFAVGVNHTMLGRNLLRPGITTLPKAMGDAGYATGIFGKWHLGDAYPCRPEDHGFEHVLVHGGGGLGQGADYWGNGLKNPFMRKASGWIATEGSATQVCFDAAASWMAEQVRAETPFFLWLAPHAVNEFLLPASGSDSGSSEEFDRSEEQLLVELDREIGKLRAAVDRLGIADETIVVFLADNGSIRTRKGPNLKGGKGSPDEGGTRVPCFFSWPDRIARDRSVTALAMHADLMPTLLGLCRVAPPVGWACSGADLSESLLGKGAFPGDRRVFTHGGRWPGDESPDRHRTNDFSVRTDRWRLTGLELFDMRSDPQQKINVFPGPSGEGSQLLADYGRWWQRMLPSLRTPVRYMVGSEEAPVIEVSSFDWWPSLEAKPGDSVQLWNHSAIQRYLERAAGGETRDRLPEASGHWKLQVARNGRYRVTMSLLPKEAPDALRAKIGVLRAGTSHVRVGKREVQGQVIQNASSVALDIDLEAGPADLEAWFGGQLLGVRKLGALYATIKRVGDRKDLTPEFRVEPEPALQGSSDSEPKPKP